MPIMKLRGMGQFGIVSDIDPYDLPIQAFSRGSNIRFTGQHIERGPVFRAGLVLSDADPRTVVSRTTTTSDDVFVGYLDGSVVLATPAGETDKSISGYTPSDAELKFTSTSLARVLFVNRSDRVPWAYLPEDTEFVTLDNWDSGWRCKILRSFNSALVALNMTKTGTDYPTMVNTSDFPTDGAVPTSWDYTVPGTNCYQNIISELEGSILDGMALNDVFYIYGPLQVFEMRATGDASLYRITSRFSDRGILGTNCVTEIGGVHFVFGLTDIYKHDGITPQSLVDEKVRERIFKNLNRSKAEYSFVSYDSNLKEVLFCFPSLDSRCAFPDTTDSKGCNQAASFNLSNGTWTFYDLPYVFDATMSSFPQVVTWASLAGTTWDLLGGAWSDLSDPIRRGHLMIGPTDAPYSLSASVYGFDLPSGGVFSFPVDTNATADVILEREGIDLDEVPPYYLRGNKTVRNIIPQIRLALDAQPLEFSFGFASGSNELPSYTDYETCDGTADLYKVDFNQDGRFLAMRIRHQDFRNFTIVGFDLDVKKLSDR